MRPPSASARFERDRSHFSWAAGLVFLGQRGLGVISSRACLICRGLWSPPLSYPFRLRLLPSAFSLSLLVQPGVPCGSLCAGSLGASSPSPCSYPASGPPKLAKTIDIGVLELSAPSTSRRSGRVATVNLGWWRSCLDGLEVFCDCVLMRRPSGHQPTVAFFEKQCLSLKLQLGATGDDIA
jgi:hypothetical protein